jgi:signal transduction histidine kinase
MAREPRRRSRRRLHTDIDRTIERALAGAGLPQVGERVGRAVGQAISEATTEIERAVGGGGRDRSRHRKPRRRARQGPPEDLNLLWGLLEIQRGPEGEEHVAILWGLIRIRSRARKPELDAAARPGFQEDPVQTAVARADSRLENVRAASILGCLGIGFVWISFAALKPFWAGIWGLVSTVLFALAAGLLVAAFAERFRRRWLAEEIGDAGARSRARRAVEGEHARAMQELSASIAHEIRNPITAAKSLVQQMGEDPACGENVEYARVALEELERVERSVSHLLRFARDEDVTRADVALADVVRDAVAALSDRARAEGVDVETELDAQGSLRGDPEKLRRVVLNLLGNALDALHESNTPSPRIQVQMGENLAGTAVWLRIRDNGPGIEPETLTAIFRPFRTSRKKGTGLGLAITKKIVEAHGGEIEVDSEPGKGAEFLITLPSAHASEPE